MLKLVYFGGMIATAKGAASMGTEFMLKLEANGSIEEVADAKVNFTKWIQLYPLLIRISPKLWQIKS